VIELKDIEKTYNIGDSEYPVLKDEVCFGPHARPVSWRSEIIEPSLPRFL